MTRETDSPSAQWALIIVLVSAPFGALAYLVFGKDHHAHDFAEPADDQQRPTDAAAGDLAVRQ